MDQGRPEVVAPPRLKGHLAQSAAIWVDFDPTVLVELARAQAQDRPGFAELLSACTRAGWTCAAYAQFVPRIRDGGVDETVILEAENEDYAIDVDRAGNPIGVELLGVAMSSEHASDRIGWRGAARLLLKSTPPRDQWDRVIAAWRLSPASRQLIEPGKRSFT